MLKLFKLSRRCLSQRNIINKIIQKKPIETRNFIKSKISNSHIHIRSYHGLIGFIFDFTMLIFVSFILMIIVGTICDIRDRLNYKK